MPKSRQVLVQYHVEDGHWWADSPDVPGFSAAGSSYEEVQQLAREGIPFFLQEEDVQVVTVDRPREPQGWWVTGLGATHGLAAESRTTYGPFSGARYARPASASDLTGGDELAATAQ